MMPCQSKHERSNTRSFATLIDDEDDAVFVFVFVLLLLLVNAFIFAFIPVRAHTSAYSFQHTYSCAYNICTNVSSTTILTSLMSMTHSTIRRTCTLINGIVSSSSGHICKKKRPVNKIHVRDGVELRKRETPIIDCNSTAMR